MEYPYDLKSNFKHLSKTDFRESKLSDDSINNWSKSFVKPLFIYGDSFIGKTTLSKLLLKNFRIIITDLFPRPESAFATWTIES